MNFLKRSMLAVAAIGAAGALVAGGSVPALAATTSGARYEIVQEASLGNDDGCEAIILSAAVSAGAPAYVSAFVLNSLPGSCTGWVEHSVNGGAWANVSAKEAAAGGGVGWFKTANFYAGPGYRVRGCIKLGTKATCSGPVSLAQSSAKPADDAVAPGYIHKEKDLSSSTTAETCGVLLSGSTKSKTAGSRANAIVLGLGEPCSGWLESLVNKGKTWAQATPTYTANGATDGAEVAFSASVADGTGHLVRACMKTGTATRCTPAW